jgi:hypothetical protein
MQEEPLDFLLLRSRILTFAFLLFTFDFREAVHLREAVLTEGRAL